jgi:hypothetical protein
MRFIKRVEKSKVRQTRVANSFVARKLKIAGFQEIFVAECRLAAAFGCVTPDSNCSANHSQNALLHL